MKKFLFSIIALLSITTLVWSCSNDDDPTPTPAPTKTDLLTKSTWKSDGTWNDCASDTWLFSKDGKMRYISPCYKDTTNSTWKFINNETTLVFFDSRYETAPANVKYEFTDTVNIKELTATSMKLQYVGESDIMSFKH